MPTHDIIDNRNEILVDHINAMLANSERAKFAVGYFFLSGFEAIRARLADLRELRLLIGDTTDAKTIEQLAEGYKRLELVQSEKEQWDFQTARAKKDNAQHAAANIRTTLELMDQTDAENELVVTLARLIEEGRVHVKVYTKGRLHSKAYIVDYPEGRYERGVAVVGSSNLSLAGVSHNTELNVVVAGNDNHAELTRWFEELWKEAQEFDESLLHALKSSWAMQALRPYDVYIKTLYALVQDRLKSEETPDLAIDLGPHLERFQRDAMKQARDILDERGGVFVSDVVGLGKTFIGTALLKHFTHLGRRPVIFCPASLAEMWQEFCDNYDIAARVVSFGILRENSIDLGDKYFRERDLVLLDESHNFRNSDTQRYSILQPYLQSKPTILITATPRNNTIWDIYYQIKLFHEQDRTDWGIDPEDLHAFFAQVEEGKRQLPELLRHILVRRTRKHILDWYGEDDGKGRRFIRIEGKPFYFPTRELVTIEYDIDAAYRGVYQNLHEMLGELGYTKYGLWNYVKKGKRNVAPYADLERAGKNLRGLMRVMIFKRLESSVEAFRLTLERLIRVHDNFQTALDQGLVAAGEDAQKLLYESNFDEETTLADTLDRLAQYSQKYRVQDFEVKRLKDNIERDIDLLKRMYRLVKDIQPASDDKLQTLKRYLAQAPLNESKVLIFTQFAETADYLAGQLGEPPEFVEIDSQTKNRTRLVGRFAPRANKYELKRGETEIRVMIATDVLSEGLNLQDCNFIINYDIHWNPVRLIQRIGRVDRIGSEHDKVLAYNFLPTREVDRHLHLKDRVHQRIQEIHDTIGEDAPILDKSEQLNEQAMYAIYLGEKETLEQFEDTQEGLGLPEAEGIIRQLQRDDPEYLDKIKSLPDGVRTARGEREPKGMFVLCQSGKYQRAYLTDLEGNIVSTDLSRALQAIRSAATEPAAALPPNHNAIVSKVKRLFADEMRQRASERKQAPRLPRSQTYALKELRVQFEQTDDEDQRQTISQLTTLFQKQLPLSAVKELNAMQHQGVPGEALVRRLERLVVQANLLAKTASEEREKTKIEIPRIVVSEALV